MQTIHVTAKSVYGQTLFYPACDGARLLAAVLGTKTIAAHALHAMDGRLVRVVQVAEASAFTGAFTGGKS